MVKYLLSGLTAVAMLGGTAGVSTVKADYWDRVEREMRQDYRQARRQARRTWRRYDDYPYRYRYGSPYGRFGYYDYDYGYGYPYGRPYRFGYGADGAVVFPFGAVYW